MKQIICHLIGHRWQSVFVGRIDGATIGVKPGVIYENVVVGARDFYANECVRCGKMTGPTVPLGKVI